LEPDDAEDGDELEPSVKRPRIDVDDLADDQPLDDDAVLALAAHNGANGTHDYPSESVSSYRPFHAVLTPLNSFGYGEA
jgi:hypothetical protein